VRAGFDLVHRAAHELGNERGLTGAELRRQYQGVLDEMRAVAERASPGGDLRAGLEHFLKVTKSYEPGLFHCYDVPGLPRTNNDLEHLFGSNRYHDRRCTGRKAASPAMVLRGPVRLVAATATRANSFRPEDLAPADAEAWRQLRAELDERRDARKQRCRFRRNPEAYLRRLEEQLRQSALPS
jgi:hypothetical protein